MLVGIKRELKIFITNPSSPAPRNYNRQTAVPRFGKDQPQLRKRWRLIAVPAELQLLVIYGEILGQHERLEGEPEQRQHEQQY